MMAVMLWHEYYIYLSPPYPPPLQRGDRGELRVYLRDTPLEARVPEDYVD